MNPLLRWLLRAPAWLYRARCGWMLGHRFLLLVHTGRNTGLRRETVLEVMAYRRAASEFVVMSGFGRNAQWLRNLAATRNPEVWTSRRRFIASYRMLPPGEAESVLQAYETRHRLAAPVIRAVLSRLLGWRYDGSGAARQRAVEQLPLVGFRPRS